MLYSKIEIQAHIICLIHNYNIVPLFFEELDKHPELLLDTPCELL
jgi:hypothetical protein